jgi:hypothetical protein
MDVGGSSYLSHRVHGWAPTPGRPGFHSQLLRTLDRKWEGDTLVIDTVATTTGFGLIVATPQPAGSSTLRSFTPSNA